jgi:hypothetical protein
MNESNWSLRARGLVTLVAVAMAVLGLGGSRALADEPIVGLWQATASNGGTPLWNVIMAWTSDGLEVEDYAFQFWKAIFATGTGSSCRAAPMPRPIRISSTMRKLENGLARPG